MNAPIEYVDELNFGEISIEKTEDIERVVSQHRRDYAEKLYMTKTTDWSSEQEYRYLWVSDRKNPPEAEFISIEGCITDICVGVRFPKAYDMNIEAVARRINCRLHRIIYLQGRLLISPFDQKYHEKMPKTISG
jgi:hypothetical protein